MRTIQDFQEFVASKGLPADTPLGFVGQGQGEKVFRVEAFEVQDVPIDGIEDTHKVLWLLEKGAGGDEKKSEPVEADQAGEGKPGGSGPGTNHPSKLKAGDKVYYHPVNDPSAEALGKRMLATVITGAEGEGLPLFNLLIESMKEGKRDLERRNVPHESNKREGRSYYSLMTEEK